MYFNKIHHPLNFVFAHEFDAEKAMLKTANKTFHLAIRDLGDEVFGVTVRNRQWPRQFSQVELERRLAGAPSKSALTVGPDGSFLLTGPDGEALLRTDEKGGFGVSGKAWLFKWVYDPAMRFYGMGEKSLGFELTGQRTKFWNTDLWADFHFHRIVHEQCDPLYISIPYVVIKQGNRYAGVLLNNPQAAFMATNPHLRIAEQSDADEVPDTDLFMGSADGRPEVYFIAGPSLAEVTSRMQRLCGVTPRPPLWALGHHQCRWGYRNFADLQELAEAYEKHRIPCSALWLDIDYMRGFRVFTFNAAHFENPKAQFEALLKRGFRVVPILDPGVKMDPAFEVYRDGLREQVFCLNPEGTTYGGFVWPGPSAFPDFSLERARAWWAGHVKRFAAGVLQGVWIDMNDPSTGASDPGEMLFGEGKYAHDTFHNQYAMGMAKATREGLLASNPKVRPFVLSRSGCTGMARYAAVWNGDNYSNEHHLRQSIPVSLNLSLSGIPFNGPDVPGFGGNADGALAALWYQAGFLFPFFRNHSATGTTRQEPWQFGDETMRIIREYVRARYKLLPYIYNLFIEQERVGHPIMRPMLYHFADSGRLPLDRVGDQYMLGPYLLHAPFLSVQDTVRDVTLPEGRWYDLVQGGWIHGGCVVQAKRSGFSTPLYVRDGAIIPMASIVPDVALPALNDVEFHAFFAPGSTADTTIRYEWDDGVSFDYRQGGWSCLNVAARMQDDRLCVNVTGKRNGAGGCQFCMVLHGQACDVDVRLPKASSSGAEAPVAIFQFAGITRRMKATAPCRLDF